MPADARPKRYPPPEFPPRKVGRFARLPPVVFLPILGLLATGLAARRGLSVLGLSTAPAELFLGSVTLLSAFVFFGLGMKILRRPAVALEDMAVLPGLAGLAAASMSVLALASVLLPYGGVAPVLVAGLMLHAAQLGLLLWNVAHRPAARRVNPAWHFSLVGFVVAAPPALALGWDKLALALLWLTLVAALAIWLASLIQAVASTPPAPLRPLLAIHLAPLALFAAVAEQAGFAALAHVFAVLAGMAVLALLFGMRWIAAAGFSPLWGAFTFPLAASASAGLTLGGIWQAPGVVLLVLALVAVPVIAWNVLKLWAGGRLALQTNAAEA